MNTIVNERCGDPCPSCGGGCALADGHWLRSDTWHVHWPRDDQGRLLDGDHAWRHSAEQKAARAVALAEAWSRATSRPRASIPETD